MIQLTINNKNFFNNIKFKRSFNSSSISFSERKFKIILDNSNEKSIINRENGLFKIYHNVYLNNIATQNNNQFMNNPNKGKFIINFTNVLVDLYDNNYDYTVFNMYFIINPLSLNLTGHIDFIKLIEHLNKYPIEYIRDENNITNF